MPVNPGMALYAGLSVDRALYAELYLINRYAGYAGLTCYSGLILKETF